jgi:cell division protein FtsA
MLAPQLKNSIYCAIDMGTASVKTVIAQKNHDSWDILGFAIHEMEGMKKGSITDLDKTIKSVQSSLEEAELQAGLKPNIVVTNIAGSYLESRNVRGVVPIRHKRVLAEDIDEAIQSAKAMPLPNNHRILHAIPQYYSIDHHRQIRDPLNMSGVKLEVDVHLVTSSIHAMRTKLQVLSHFGLQANYVVFDPLAIAEDLLLIDEKELGVAVLDLGAGTSKISIFYHKSLLYSKVLPIGGDQVTSDLALAFRTPVAAAEVLKIRHGGVHSSLRQIEDQIINIPELGSKQPQQIMRTAVLDVITARLEEVFQLIVEDLEQKNLLSCMRSGLVLTGGLVKLQDINQLAERVFRVPVRVGLPSLSHKDHKLLESPLCATVIGLLQWAHAHEHHNLAIAESTGLNMFWVKVKNWLTG